MNASTALATVLVDELVRCGVREVVLAPGSRSAPLAYAVQAAERTGRLRLHVRVDERSAGFLALGLAKVARRPAVVITTSGTAVANLHPAVLEAHHSDVPLIVLSADRPDELRGTGANQTTAQPGIFAGAVRWQHDLTNFGGGFVGPERIFAGVSPVAHPSWRTTVDRAWAAATGGLGTQSGPVHLNVAFRDPLSPDLPVGSELSDQLAGRPDGGPWTSVQPFATHDALPPLVGHSELPPLVGHSELPPLPGQSIGTADSGPATLMVLGDLPDPALTEQALAVAVAQGWPVIAEPFGAGDRSTVLPHGSLVLTATEWLGRHAPERVLVVGRCTLNRETGALVRRNGIRVEAITPRGTWPDPSHAVQRVHDWSALARTADLLAGQDVQWAQTWRRATQLIADAVAPLLAASWPSGPAVAQQVLSALSEDDLLVLGSSNTARAMDRIGLAGRRLLVTGNRGLAGIDGTNATAVGVALSAAPRRTVALMGDLTFLHDLNGLLIGPNEPRPDLSIVVVNDDGGGIFATLEYGEPQRAADFERVFGTPTGADLQAACTAYGVGHELLESAGALTDALSRPAQGIRVLEVPVPRSGHRELGTELARATAEVLRAAS